MISHQILLAAEVVKLIKLNIYEVKEIDRPLILNKLPENSQGPDSLNTELPQSKQYKENDINTTPKPHIFLIFFFDNKHMINIIKKQR